MEEPTILYEDADILVVDKPPGLLVHPAEGTEDADTLSAWLQRTHPQVVGIGEEGRYGIVHRLDRDTSGVMVMALTEGAYARLKKEFARREVQKTYRAFVYGNLKEDRGIIDRAIGRSPSGSRSARLPLGEEDEARAAQTTFKTLMRSADASYLELYPKTGRTHQIRVHLSLLQHPVVCDKRYAPGKKPILGFERLALHALRLAFTHPESGKEAVYDAPLPPDFRKAERILKEELH